MMPAAECTISGAKEKQIIIEPKHWTETELLPSFFHFYYMFKLFLQSKIFPFISCKCFLQLLKQWSVILHVLPLQMMEAFLHFTLGTCFTSML